MTAERPLAELVAFLLATALLSGVPWAVVLFLGGDTSTPLVTVFYALGTFGPTLAALVCRLCGMRSPRLARWRHATRWVPTAVVAGVLPAVAAFMAGGSFAGTAGLPLLLLAHTVTGPLSEEFGWRGFAQPRLRHHLSPTSTALVLGTVWAAWHLPFFAMTGTWQSTLGLGEAAIYLACMIPMSLVYWAVSETLRGGVPAAVLLHYASNVSLSLLPLTVFGQFVVYGLSWVVLATVVALSPPARAAARRAGSGWW